MRLLALLAALPALALAQTLDVTVTKPVQCERKTRNGDSIAMMYKGTLLDGTKFDSSYDSGVPFKFTLGKGQVIAGWDQGLLGMCIGEGRKLVIPSNLAYGSQRVGPIPAGSTLGELLLLLEYGCG
jgi:FKBP-type peptidyl-prolyl cis-trans isomerase